MKERKDLQENEERRRGETVEGRKERLGIERQMKGRKAADGREERIFMTDRDNKNKKK